MSAAPNVLVLNLGWEQRPLVDALRARSCVLFGVHADAAAVPDGRWDEVLIAGMRELDRIVAFADRVRPDAVISDECDYAAFAQAVLADRYRLPGPGLGAAQRTINKRLQRECARAAGIPVPEFAACHEPDDARRLASAVGWPIILKPVDNRGSIGVARVDGPADLDAAFTRALVNSHARVVLAERFVTGEHLTIDGYCVGGDPQALAVGSNRKFDGDRGIVNEAIVYPAGLSTALATAAGALAERTATALNYRFGPFHGEFIVERSTGDLLLTEMSNRGGGVHISNLVLPFLTGADLVNRHVDDALGIDGTSALPRAHPDRSALLRFVADDRLVGRRLRAVRGLDAARREASVLAVQVFPAPGDTFGGAENGAARHAMVITGGSAGVDLDRRAEQALSRLRFDVEPPL